MSMKILFVCTGNTCRSCMAEAIAKTESKAMGLDIQFSSAGIFALLGGSASYNASKVMEEMGYDLSCHISTPLTADKITETNIILTMTKSHKKAVINTFPASVEKVFTLMEYIGEDSDVEDPFGGDITVYRECATQLKLAINKLLVKIKES